ncbi:MAG: hypothetical protein P8J87_17590 [Verrucomicrobiales bacterium]|nr:hypothetical protein [Verrucomicrobiales bacterium]
MSEDPAKPAVEGDDSHGEIVCFTTRWYFNRMGLMFLMVAGFSGWFLYDGLVKYPKEIELYALYQSYDEPSKAYQELEASGSLQEWPAQAKENGWSEGKPEDWADYAEANGLAEEPDERVAGDEKEQHFFAGLTGLIAVVILVMFLLNRSKQLRADAVSLTTPKGVTVRFADVFRVDKRKWRYKGLAYLFYKGEDGSESKAVIDDLKFGGADKVLERLMETFEGELIDRMDDDDDGPDAGGGEAGGEAGGEVKDGEKS